MRTRYFAVLAIAVVAIVGLGLSTASASADLKPDREYVALGDSLAVGVGATVPDQLGYVARFNNRYFRANGNGPGVLTNLSVSGETSATFISRGQLAAAVAAIGNPDRDVELVTLDIGGNDLLGLLSPGSPCTVDPDSLACQADVAATITAFAGNYGQIVGTLAAVLAAEPGDETLMVMTYYNLFDGIGHPLEPAVDRALLGGDLKIDCVAFHPVFGNPANIGVNDVIACVGQSFGATAVDVHPLFDGRALELTHMAVGDFHPNNHGHKVIAQAFVDEVTPQSPPDEGDDGGEEEDDGVRYDTNGGRIRGD